MTTTPPTDPAGASAAPEPGARKATKYVKARHSWVWAVFVAAGLALEATGLRRGSPHGPLSHVVWDVTADRYGFWWWTVMAALLWLLLHFGWPRVAAFGWAGLAALLVTAWAWWAVGSYVTRWY